MIDPTHHRLSISRQCTLAGVSRSSFYYQGKGETPLNLKLMRLIDEQWLDAVLWQPPHGPLSAKRKLLRGPQKGAALDAQDGH